MTLREALTTRPGPGAPALDRLFPFARALRAYHFDAFRLDLLAGLTVALFTIPQALAYALIFGYPPLAGIGTAVVASILGAVFGSSEFLVNGPTNAISVMLLASAPAFAAIGDPLVVIPAFTLALGLMQTVAAGLRLGSFTRFVSEPVLTGFTAGAGLYIVINQVPEFLGLSKSAIAKELWGWVPPKAALFDLVRDLDSLAGVNPASLAVAAGTFVTVRLIQRFEKRLQRKLPAPFMAIVLATLAAWALGLGDPGAGAAKIKLVRDIQPLTRTLPAFSWPQGSVRDVLSLWEPMVAIGLLGAVEAIAIGKALAARAGHPFDASRQLLGEGLCNVGAGLVGGFASSGSFSRTAVNFEAGAVTRISVVLSGLLVMGIVLAFAPAANFIPAAALAGTLVHIGLKLVDVTRIQALVLSTTGDRLVLVATAGAVLLTEKLETAFFVGMGLSMLLALRRAGSFKLTFIRENEHGGLDEVELEPGAPTPVRIVNLQGELFFAAAEVLRERLQEELDRCEILVLRVQDAYNLDATTADALEQVARAARQRGGRLLLCGVKPGTLGTLRRSGALHAIGEDGVFPIEKEMLASTRRALAAAHALVKKA